jgi:hypothetical protein
MTRQVLFAAAALFAVALASATVDGQAPKPAAKPTPQAGAPTKLPAPAGSLPPLPQVPFEPVLPMPVVQQVYEFAARHPEVLQYIPCYCGCERMGHQGNDQCFVKSRAANGRITEWEPHGMGCQVCLEVGRKSMTMFNQGMSVPEIRAAIEREYARYPSHTPTPYPPKAKAAAKKS